ncbi:MAG: tetratricopeptide repeat protein [Phycisphaerae bacterium]|nr:tetratricopeptide repeat protein [Phycisphaerae bacterium]
MARVNNKLLVIVTLATVVTGAVVAGVLLLNYRADPTRHIRNGDAALAAGDFQKAADFYGRAIGKRPNALEYHAKYLDAAGKVTPASSSEARERYGRFVGSLIKRAQIARDDEKFWRVVLEELRMQAELSENSAMWQAVHDRISSDMIGTLTTDDKLLPLAKVYQGFAQAQRMSSLAPEEINAAVSDLDAILPALKGDDRDMAYGSLLQIRFTQARNLELAGQARQATDAWKVFDDLLAKAKVDAPNGIHVSRGEIARLRAKREAGDASITAAMVGAECDKVSATALASDDPLRVYDAARVISISAVPDWMQRSATLLESYLAKHPDALLHRRVLSYNLQYLDVNRAEEQARVILESKPLPVGLLSASQEEIRISAAQQLFDIEFSRLGKAENDAARTAVIERLTQARAKLETLTKGQTDDSALVRADGKLLYAKSDFAGASVKFNEIFRRGTLVDAELYVLASANAEQLNMLGLALQHASSGLDLAPGNLDLLERKGALELRVGRPADAVRTLKQVVDRDPTRERVKQLLALATTNQEKGGVPDEKDPIVQLLQRAQQAFEKKDLAGAKKIIGEGLEKNPNDVRLIAAMATTLATDGDNDTALELVNRGLTIDPSNLALKKIHPFVSSKDPSMRVVAMVARTYPEGNDRTVWTYVRLTNLADMTEAGLPALEKSNPTEFARQKALVPEIRRAEAEWKAKSVATDPNHPALMDLKFTKAMEKKDFAAGQQLINEAESAKRDPALPFMFRARLAVNQSKFGETVTILQQALDQNIETADVFRLMGYAHEQGGNLAAALKSYGEGYKRDPTNMNNVRAYVGAMIKSGDRQQGLVILRDARRVAGDDAEIGEYWIALENEIGDRRLARGMRETRYRLVPGDKRNALALATMLAETQPEREDIGDEKGVTKYNDPQWRSLEPATRQRELNAAREFWRKQSDKIFSELIAAEPLNPELVLVRAATLRRQAKYGEAEAALKTMIASAGEKAEPGMWVALGTHYSETGDLAKSTAAFDQAVKIQNDETRDGDGSIGEYWFQKSQWDRAVQHLERVAEKVKNRSLSLRLAEAYGRLRQFDKAKARLDEAVAGGPRDIVVDQLEASILEQQGDDLRARGDMPAAQKSYESALVSLKRARDVMQNNPIVAVQESSVYKKQFDATGDRAKLDLALASADRATKLRADYWPAAQAKSELLLAVPDPQGSITELERFVKAAPSISDGRRRLIEILVAMENPGRANELVRDAISLAPNDPQWRVAQGELSLQAGNLDQAILAYEEANRTKPDRSYLHRLIDLRLRKSPPDWDATLAQLRDRADDVRASPYLQSAIGAALFNTGEQKRGLDALRESFRFAKRSALDGSGEPGAIDGWFTNLRLVYPPARTADAEKFVSETAEGKLDARDQRWLAEAWLASGPDGTSRAIELSDKAIAIDEKKDARLTARLYDLVGGAKYSLGDCKAGLASFEKAIALLPDEPSLLNNFAYLCGECGDDLAKGVAAAQKASRIAVGRPEYLDTLGYLLARTGEKLKAIEALNASLKLSPSASAHFHLAEIMADEGRKDDAKASLRSAGDLNKDPVLQKRINALIEKLR